MKKRTILIPATLMALSSCSPQPDLSNQYGSLAECLEDNNPKEIQLALCSTKKLSEESCENAHPIKEVTKKYACQTIENEGKRIVIGPQFPSEYYEKAQASGGGSTGGGLLMGYWLGRSLHRPSSASTSSLYHSSSNKSYSPSSFKSAGGSRMSISRGGFGSSGFRGGIGG